MKIFYFDKKIFIRSVQLGLHIEEKECLYHGIVFPCGPYAYHYFEQTTHGCISNKEMFFKVRWCDC